MSPSCRGLRNASQSINSRSFFFGPCSRRRLEPRVYAFREICVILCRQTLNITPMDFTQDIALELCILSVKINALAAALSEDQKQLYKEHLSTELKNLHQIDLEKLNNYDIVLKILKNLH